jgi:hypothetical protein
MFGFYISHNIASRSSASLPVVRRHWQHVLSALQRCGIQTSRVTSQRPVVTFYSFIVHGAFGPRHRAVGAAGLRLGHALIAPGRNTPAIFTQARATAVIIRLRHHHMLLIAAAIEAFWSSARWLPLKAKYSSPRCAGSRC